MLAIRLQRQGKTHYATYRVVVQDSHKSPTSGKIVEYLGSYNPHTKDVQINKELAEKYLNNGAQPSPRVAKLLQELKVKLPNWVKIPKLDAKKAIKNPEKLRRNQPKEEEVVEEIVEETAEATETPAETAEEAPKGDA
jgi:small subunit ribosomal protein S16